MENTDILTPKLILDSRACILLPEKIYEMELERIGQLYQNHSKPNQVFVYGDEEFWVSLTLTDEAVSKGMLITKLCQYRRILIKKYRGLEMGEVCCVDSVIPEDKTYYFPIYTKGVMEITCQLIFLQLIQGREMIGTVCCSDEKRHSRMVLFRKIIGSVVDLTGTWEYIIRGKGLYGKAKKYYKDY